MWEIAWEDLLTPDNLAGGLSPGKQEQKFSLVTVKLALLTYLREWNLKSFVL